jgi:hypothetical protein
MTTHKTPERHALELPYAKDKERSVEARMMRGRPPVGLPAFISWFREVCQGEAPTAIHKRALWHDHGEAAEGGSKLGTLAWSDPFRRFIEAVDGPSALDEEGYYRFPLRSALSRMSRKWPLTARALYQLALMDGDWRLLADKMSYPDEFMELYAERALYQLWREYSELRRLT